jgi:uncharacterized protein
LLPLKILREGPLLEPPDTVAADFAPIEMVVLQGTSYCNLNCSYCYLSEASRRTRGSMSLATIRRIFETLLSSEFVHGRLRVSWHSGEPLVLPPLYYREAIDAVLEIRDRILGADFDIQFDIQTNGTLITQAWCDLLNEYKQVLTIGVSCDGPASLHDLHRRNWADRPTHAQTDAGMERLAANGIPFDVTAVVSKEGLERPEEFLAYFSRFTPSIREFHFNLHDEFFIADERSPVLEAFRQQYASFLRALLDITASAPIYPRIRNFSLFFNRLFADETTRPAYDAGSMCKPFRTLSIESNGDVTTFYAGLTLDECRDLKNLYDDGRGFVIGNILQQDMSQIARSPKLGKIMTDFQTSHTACQRSCEYYELCSGGYNLIKYRRFGTFDATETPECSVHVKTMAATLLAHINDHVSR